MPLQINPTSAKVQIDSSVDTIIHLLVDASGSMRGVKAQTRSGMNEYIGKIPKSKPDSRTLVSVTAFDTDESDQFRLRELRSYMDINEIEEIREDEYLPYGMTPLLESIVVTAGETDAVARTSPTPPAVIFVIITDGYENRSRAEFTKAVVRGLIESKTKNDKWTVVYLGANQDAFAESASLGIAKGNSVNFNVGATREAFLSAGTASAAYTSSNSTLRSTVGKSARYETANAFAEAGIDNTKEIDK